MLVRVGRASLVGSRAAARLSRLLLLASLMALNMLVQVRLLREAQVAALVGVWARKWPLLRVDAQVVVEVVELAEELLAAHVVTLQDLLVAARLWVPVFENPELASARHERAASSLAIVKVRVLVVVVSGVSALHVDA